MARIQERQGMLQRCDDGPEELATTTEASEDEPKVSTTTTDASAEEAEDTKTSK